MTEVFRSKLLRFVRGILLVTLLAVSLAYVLIKGVAYLRSPALLGDDPASRMLSVLRLGAMLFVAFLSVRQLNSTLRPREATERKIPSLERAIHPPGSYREAVGVFATVAIRRPMFAVAIAIFLLSMPILLVALAHGGDFASVPLVVLLTLLVLELLVAATLILVLIRARRLRIEAPVRPPTE